MGLGIFEEVAAVQRRERDREAAFALISEAFAKLGRQDQVLMLAKLANTIESPALSKATVETTNGHAAIGATTTGQQGRRVMATADHLTAAQLKEMTPTNLTRHVVQLANAPLMIDEIVAQVVRLRPDTPKPEIYSAVYKATKRREFNKTGDSYAYNPDFRRGHGGRDGTDGA